MDGQEVPLEVLATPIPTGDRNLYVMVSRDISERKKAEQEIRDLNQTLERRIPERTSELSAREAQLRTLIEHAPEAIVVFSGETGRFLSCNGNAIRLYGLSREQLLKLTPGQVCVRAKRGGALARRRDKVLPKRTATCIVKPRRILG